MVLKPNKRSIMNFLNFFLVLCIFIRPVMGTSLSEWNALDKDEKYEVLDSGALESIEVDFDDLQDDLFKEQLVAMKENVISTVGTEPIDNDIWNSEIIFTIGEIEIGTIEMFSIEGRAVAVNIWLYQDGGASFNSEIVEVKHYSSEEDALAAGMDPDADVSWQVVSSFELTSEGFSEVLIDHWNEGGFSWTGW
jgi:hypothetical protein